VTLLNFDVRFTPESGHSVQAAGGGKPSSSLAVRPLSELNGPDSHLPRNFL
jgi:hypothetical protein